MPWGANRAHAQIVRRFGSVLGTRNGSAEHSGAVKALIHRRMQCRRQDSNLRPTSTFACHRSRSAGQMESVGLSETERKARALERLFDQHYAAVLAYGLRRAPRAVAEDVASETFVIASRRIDEVPAAALPWLYGVARRVLANEAPCRDAA